VISIAPLLNGTMLICGIELRLSTNVDANKPENINVSLTNICTIKPKLKPLFKCNATTSVQFSDKQMHKINNTINATDTITVVDVSAKIMNANNNIDTTINIKPVWLMLTIATDCGKLCCELKL
jgi:hypothetical protein